MVSSKQKGRAAEKQFREVLHHWGFEDEQIEQARPTYKPIGGGRVISSQNDFFNLYDFIVRSKELTMYIQVKSTDAHSSTAKKNILEDIEKYAREEGEMYLIAQKIPRKGFLLRYLYPTERKENINFKGETIWEPRETTA